MIWTGGLAVLTTPGRHSLASKNANTLGIPCNETAECRTFPYSTIIFVLFQLIAIFARHRFILYGNSYHRHTAVVERISSVAKIPHMIEAYGSGIYGLGGLCIASDFPLFGLQVCRNETEARCEVVIRCAPIPEEVASATAKFLDGKYTGTYNGRDLLLDSPAVGRFLVRAGQEI